MVRLFNNSWTIYQNLTTMPAAEPWLVSCATIVRQTADCYGNPINAQFIIVWPYSHVGVLLSLQLNCSFVWNVRIFKHSSSHLKLIVMNFLFVFRVWQWLHLLPVKDLFFTDLLKYPFFYNKYVNFTFSAGVLLRCQMNNQVWLLKLSSCN